MVLIESRRSDAVYVVMLGRSEAIKLLLMLQWQYFSKATGMTIYGYVLEEISRVSLNLNKQWIVAISLKKEREIMPADGNPSSIYGFT